VSAADRESSMPLGLGSIGCGGMARELAITIRDRVPEARLVAGYDPYEPHRDRLCQEVGAAPAASLDELLARPDVDAVLVASPNFLHVEHVLAAAAAGKHVFCEKPMALTVADCDAMIAACERAGLKLMVGQSTRLLPSMLKLRALVASGELGKPWHGFSRYWFTGFKQRDSGVWHVERARCGGLFFQMAIHHIDLFHAVFGPARRVQYAGGHYGAQIVDFDDIASILVDYQSGATAAISVSGVAPIGVNEIAVLFSGGYAHTQDPYSQLGFGADREHCVVAKGDDLPSPGGVTLELSSFVRWVQHDEAPVMTAAEGRAAVVVAEAARRAEETGGPVEIAG
jgi:myo-inositol 2-dehydrogenase/D-chiro-inositol 1-dehydrogenase